MEEVETVESIDNTSADTADNVVSDVPVEETNVEEENYSLDDLLNLTQEDFEEMADDANHKGMKPLNEWVKNLPEDVRKHLGNLRASYTRKTQSLSQERNSLKSELEAERAALQAERAALYNGDMAKRTREIASSEEDFDIYDPEGLKAEIQRQAAKMMSELLQPAQTQLAVEQRKVALNQFASEHPDLRSDEYRMPIAEMLRDRPELKLEDAYFIVKAKVDAQKLNQEREDVANDRARRRSSFAKVSTGASSKPTGSPNFGNDAWAAYQWHKTNAVKK